VTERSIPAALPRQVADRADQGCEYCLLPEDVACFPHDVDQSVAINHGGPTEAAHLAFACWRCNRHTGTDLRSFDPLTGTFCFLLHPHTQVWTEHVALMNAELIGLMPAGHTTICLLQLNAAERITERQRLLSVGRYGLTSATD